MKFWSGTNIFLNFVKLILLQNIKNKIVFVEVKTRKTDAFGMPMEAITRTKYNNIKTGVLNYISECKIKIIKLMQLE